MGLSFAYLIGRQLRIDVGDRFVLRDHSYRGASYVAVPAMTGAVQEIAWVFPCLWRYLLLSAQCLDV
jgi:hypothetical protein